ncbi:MAG: PDZ domain-containing protein [Deltaproteobacteria bacterium]|nr:PDZ domain-containing protein [Deltaproteobacteria bacterium]
MRIVEKYHYLLVLLAITAITYALVGVGYDLLSFKLLKSGITPRPAVEEAASLNTSKKEPADAYTVIPQRNLFGSTEKAAANKNYGAAAPAEGLYLATVLEVKGTVAGTGKDGFAIIEEKGKNKQLLYKVGNVVAGAKVVKITRNAVTFLVGDKERVLKMADTNQAPLLPPRPSGPPAAGSLSAAPMVVTRSEVDASLKDMGTMLSQAQIRPYYADGVPDGFMVTNIKPGSIYERIGLTEGDIVQGTNDRRLVTADDMTALYNSMKAGSSLTLKIKRGGQQQNIQYVFQ